MDFAARYHALIDWTLASSGMSDKLVHVHVGLAIYVGVQMLLRTRRSSLHALTVVFAAEAVNETLDRLYSGTWNWPDTSLDFLATMFWPTVLVLASQHRRQRWARAERLRRQASALMAGMHEPHHGVPVVRRVTHR